MTLIDHFGSHRDSALTLTAIDAARQATLGQHCTTHQAKLVYSRLRHAQLATPAQMFGPGASSGMIAVAIPDWHEMEQPVADPFHRIHLFEGRIPDPHENDTSVA